MKKVIVTLICMFLFIVPASASEINHFYAESDDAVALRDTVNASAALAGTKISADGKVNGVLFGAGNDVTLSGEVDYGVVAGNNVDVTGTVLKDAAIAGNVVEFNGSNLQRDTLIAASKTNLSGKFGRNITVASEIVDVNDVTIGGNLKLYAENIEIGDNVKIAGTLTYPENAKVKISDGAVIGKVEKSAAIDNEATWVEIMTEKVFSILSLVLIFVVISLLLPKLFEKIDKKYEKFGFDKGIEVFTKGLLFIVAIPVISILLLTIVIGMPLAFILIALYVIAIYLSKIFAAYLIGSKIADKWMKDTSVLVKGLIGLAIIFVISIIPYFGSLLTIIIVLVGLGVLIDSIRK